MNEPAEQGPWSGSVAGLMKIDVVCERFEDAWQSDSPPRIEEYLEGASLPEPEAARELLVELVALDLEYRWRRASAEATPLAVPPPPLPLWPKLEDYLSCFPALGPLEQLPESLISHEYQVRHLWGDRPERDEYQQRFASHRSDLKKLLDEVDRHVAAEWRPSSAGSDRSSQADVGQGPGEAEAKAGHYRILRPHACGGLGRVWLAVDEELNREVALKELLEHRAGDDLCRRRFEREAEITGSLEHPGIVPVYGFGFYADGRPFYAMRFVRGATLKEAVEKFHQLRAEGREDLSSLGFRQLLGHFVAVCNTIQYAHSRGIVHRDLKPGNVMLGDYGETLVVDWGLAKSIRRAEEPAELASPADRIIRTRPAATQLGALLGTPVYMSPEQAAGRADQAGTASDIYGLGAILYTILTGRPPFEAESSSSLLRRVQQGDFPPPQAAPGVPLALSAVCMKAMAREPGDRYITAAALAGDIEHWLADEPVSVYRGSLAQRATRWMRRHRSWTLAGAASLVLVAAVSLAAALLVNQARREAEALAVSNKALADRERAALGEAMRRFRDAREATDTWLTGASEVLRYHPGMQETRKHLLEKAAEDYERFAREKSADPGLEAERGRTHVRLGDVRRLLGKPSEARRAYQAAIDLFGRLLKDQPDAVEYQVELANSRTKLGLVDGDLGRLQEADACYGRALGAVEPLAESHPDHLGIQDALASSLLNRAMLRARTGKHEEAAQTMRRSAAIFQRLRAARPDDPRPHDSLATAQCLLGGLLAEEGRYDEAIREFEQAVASYDRLLQRQPSHPKHLESRALTRIHLATALRGLGRYAAERSAYRQAEADYRTLAKAIPDAVAYEEQLAVTWIDLAQLLHHCGENVEAEAEARRATAALAGLASRFAAEVPRFREELAAAQAVLGQVLLDLDRASDAKAALEPAVESCRQLAREFADVPQYRERLAVAQSHLARACCRLGDAKTARQRFEEAAGMLDELHETAPQIAGYRNEAAFVHQRLGELLLDAGQADQAEAAYRRALALREALAAEVPSAENRHEWAKLLIECPVAKLRDPALALKQIEKALQLAPHNPLYWSTAGAAHYRSGDGQGSVSALRKAIGLRQACPAPDAFYLALAEAQLGLHEQAMSHLQAGKRWREANCPGRAEMKRLEQEATAVVLE